MMKPKQILMIAVPVLLIGIVAFLMIFIVPGMGQSTPNAYWVTAQDFLVSIHDLNFNHAFEILSPTLKNEIGSPENLAQVLYSKDVIPEKWSLDKETPDASRMILDGSVTFKNGKRGTVEIRLWKYEGNWEIISYSLKPN
jgi:hypothetical protein